VNWVISYLFSMPKSDTWILIHIYTLVCTSCFGSITNIFLSWYLCTYISFWIFTIKFLIFGRSFHMKCFCSCLCSVPFSILESQVAELRGYFFAWPLQKLANKPAMMQLSPQEKRMRLLYLVFYKPRKLGVKVTNSFLL
jgi:hypothetical protein